MPANSKVDWAGFQQQLRARGERRLVLVEGDRDMGLDWLGRVLGCLEFEVGLWNGDASEQPNPGLVAIKPTAGVRWLGRETQVLVWDGWRGNPPDSLAALSGTLTAGGLWFWLMPPLASWATFPDPDYRRTGIENAPAHPFADRMARVIGEDPEVIRVRVGPEASHEPHALPHLPVPGSAFEPGGTDDQASAIEAITRTARGRRKRPLVITAERGRGKSAALGIAAVRWLAESGHPCHVAVTAPSPGAAATLFRHGRETAGNRLIKGETPDDDVSSATGQISLHCGSTVTFHAIDELLRNRPPADLVLVDEAAAIPAPLLKSVLLGWPRVVYATTTHGYEGSGRGFALRFHRVLQAHAPQWRRITLSQPVRWANDDPLETLIRKLFLLNAESPDVPVAGPVTITPWHPARASEIELREVFGLLVDAHYRTTPGDLRQWLDDPLGQSWLAQAGGRIVGVLWGSVEGGLEPGLAQQVAQGSRRLRGHLLPQSLANHSGFAKAAELRLARIIRIAVVDQWRRQGVGQALVAAARDWAVDKGLDGLGSSFGAAPDLLGFWRRCGLAVMRLGLQREASSGEYAVQVLCGLSASAESLAGQIQSRFAEHWPMLLPRVWPTLSPEVALAVSAQMSGPLGLSPLDRTELAGFCQGHRGLELSLLPLIRLTLQPGAAARLMASPEHILWCRKILQGWSWGELQDAGLCAGRRDGEARLRELAGQLEAALSEPVHKPIPETDPFTNL
ncbi:tRNA(Met) cytidine acetyltransferase TmcA [Marinobacter salicampi]|uniref:tRNA(Met) cytidine acetyltransferase TmcA n=1 Tax=Marinobacter salicampi TaxID=435907 RepID=UPI001F5EFD74|nr:GNAT family N-acetyltransferase [Marinobacter salicampi]